MRAFTRGHLLSILTVMAMAVGTLSVAPASAEPATQGDRVTVSDGTSLAVSIRGEQPLAARPTVVEFTPYGSSGAAFTVGPE